MSMVEKVARAIWGDRALGGIPWDEAGPEYRAITLEEARRAIEAMRQPDASMIVAATRTHVERRRDMGRSDFEAKWEAAINDALESE